MRSSSRETSPRTGYKRSAHSIRAAFLGWFASTDITKPGAEEILTNAVKSGASGFGEMKFHVEAAGPELRRMYALAAELNVPILIHFQEVPHTPTEGVFATGFRNFEAMLKAYPKTKFIGHADAFWANISADYANEAAYPAGKIKRGGVTDRLLGDYPNLYGDLSANSGNNALSRDPEFTPGFLERHQDKLIFGSDCACSDGKGGGVSQGNNPTAARMAGKCVARETLSLLKRTTSPAGVSKARLGQRAQDVCLEGLERINSRASAARSGRWEHWRVSAGRVRGTFERILPGKRCGHRARADCCM